LCSLIIAAVIFTYLDYFFPLRLPKDDL